MVEAVQPKTLSFIVTDLRTRTLVGIRKDTFEELLKAAGIPGRYFYRWSFTTWDVLLPSEELAVKLAVSIISSKFFQPEYKSKRRIKVTMCNVPIQINGNVLAAYLSEYGGIEDVTTAKSTSGMAHSDYFVTMCLDRGGFPHTIEYEDQVMIVVIEGRRPQYWKCKQLGHFTRSCPQKTTKPTSTTTTVATITAINPQSNQSSNPETGDHPAKEEGCTQVTWKGEKKFPNKISNHNNNYSSKNFNSGSSSRSDNNINNKSNSSTNPITSIIALKKKRNLPEEQPEDIDISINLKKRVGGQWWHIWRKKVRKVSQPQPQIQLKTKQQPQHKSYHLNPHNSNISYLNIRTMKLPYSQHCPPFHLPGCSPSLIWKPETTPHHRNH